MISIPKLGSLAFIKGITSSVEYPKMTKSAKYFWYTLIAVDRGMVFHLISSFSVGDQEYAESISIISSIPIFLSTAGFSSCKRF